MKKYLILIIALLLVTGCAKQGDVQPEVQDVVPAEETAPAAPEEAAPAEETPIETPEEPAEEETPGTVIAEELPNEEEPTVDTAPVDEESSLPYQVVLMKDL
ncbi:MAG: lipoprotein, partial [Nanoarchaeota archaeon]|nr:lipoprotein [Nanoarchaeota archaeon]